MDYGPIVLSIIFWILSGIGCRWCLPPFEKDTDRQVKILSWLIVTLMFGLSIAVTFISTQSNMEKAIIDYDRRRYKVELKVSIDTIKTVKRCPKLYKHTVPYVTEPQPMRFIPPMTWEKGQESQDSLLPYSQLDSLK